MSEPRLRDAIVISGKLQIGIDCLLGCRFFLLLRSQQNSPFGTRQCGLAQKLFGSRVIFRHSTAIIVFLEILPNTVVERASIVRVRTRNDTQRDAKPA